MSKTLLEKIEDAGFFPKFYPTGVGTAVDFPDDHYLNWPTFWFEGDFDLKVFTDLYIQHLEEVGTPWQKRTDLVEGEKLPLTLAVKVQVIRPDSHMVHVYPAEGLVDLY